MPGFQAERGAGQGVPVSSIRDYWKNPTRNLPPLAASEAALAAKPSRRTAPLVRTPSLWEQTDLVETRPGTTMLTSERPSQYVKKGRIVTHSHQETQQLRERLQQYGSMALSTPELLSLILQTGQGNGVTVERTQALLAEYRLPELLNADIGQLIQQLGEVKAVQVKAVLEVARRLLLPSPDEKYTIKSPEDAAKLVIPYMAYLDHEEMRVLALDSKNVVVANQRLYQGTINSSAIRAAEIFRLAVTRNCAGVIIVHNHPTGNTTPSPEDIAVTQQLVEAGKVLDTELIDHLIIGTPPSFISLRERLGW